VGAALTAVLLAAAMVLMQSGWELVLALFLSGILSTGLPPPFSVIIRALPSGWGVVAVEAAYRSDWLLVGGALVGLVVVILLLLVVWGWLLSLPRAAWVTVRGSRGGAEMGWPALRHVGLSGGTAAMVVKELRSWRRDPTRTMALVLAPAWALMTCLLPLTLAPITSLTTILLPWAGPATLLMAAPVTANLYGLDGTALWLTVLTPGAARHDVRGRQWAWLVVFAPLTLVIAILLTALSGQDWTWPWVVALVPALLGGGVGLSLWASVVALAPGRDPQRAKGSQLERPASGMAYVLFWMALLPAVPAASVVLTGTLLHNDALRWAGVPVGIGTGVFLAWWLGFVAYRRLEARGPELLSLMRNGPTSSAAKTVEARPNVNVFATMSRWDLARFTLLYPAIGSIALVPQGIVPLIIKLSGGRQRVWFLALYLPEVWQWPTTALMILIGLGCFGALLHLYWTHRRKWYQLQAEKMEVAPERSLG
jgi:ABC-2 type transport system permease protein